MTQVLIRGMHGLGDNIFQRAFVKTLVRTHDVYIKTTWPEIYEDLPVKFVRDTTTLRTQGKNLRLQPDSRYVGFPANAEVRTIAYGHGQLTNGTIIGAMQRCFNVPPADWDLPKYPPPFVSDKPIAVVRPVTERKEWFNAARSPLPRYINEIAALLISEGFHVVSVADVSPGEEWIVGEAPPCHEAYHQGELHVRDLLGLVRSAAVVVGGVGWIVPACVATRTPLFCVLGGQGMHNAPTKITDRRMDLKNVGFALPDQFCMCADMRHNCNKTIRNVRQQWDTWRKRVGLLDPRSVAADVGT